LHGVIKSIVLSELVILEVKSVVSSKRLFVGIFSWVEFSAVEFLRLGNGLSSNLFIIFIINEFNEVISSWKFMHNSVGLSL